MKNMFFALLLFSLVSCVNYSKKIDNYNNPQKALLVIDMQMDYVDEKGKFPIEISQINNLIETINMIIDDFQKNNWPKFELFKAGGQEKGQAALMDKNTKKAASFYLADCSSNA
jgi:isochorismate hydrolase